MVDGRVHPATMPMSSPALNSAAVRGPGGQSAIDVASCRLDNRTDDVPNARPNPVAAQVYFEQAKTIRPHSTRWSPQPGGHSRTWLSCRRHMAVGDASVVAGVRGRRIGVRATARNPTSGPGAPRRLGRDPARRHRHTSMDSRVGVDPISDPDTAIMEMLPAA